MRLDYSRDLKKEYNIIGIFLFRISSEIEYLKTQI